MDSSFHIPLREVIIYTMLECNEGFKRPNQRGKLLIQFHSYVADVCSEQLFEVNFRDSRVFQSVYVLFHSERQMVEITGSFLSSTTKRGDLSKVLSGSFIF